MTRPFDRERLCNALRAAVMKPRKVFSQQKNFKDAIVKFIKGIISISQSSKSSASKKTIQELEKI